ncbi:Pirin-like protein [Zalerion maritima]|uniref:Pirin-like protein n=1 Tax=Zalerion maritima TaxID=339359 RepID=A0AAD5WP22_9PEZI|nr:Pirin-like protein [Zalerion maritima]
MKTLAFVLSVVIALVSIVAFLFQDEISTALASSSVVASALGYIPAGILEKLPFVVGKELDTSAEALSSEGTSFPWDHEPLIASDMSAPRAIRKVFKAVEQAEGAGARVRRSVGTAHLKNFSPFLMCDHFSISPGAGFPDHPHRGQETITYLLSGAVDHEDFTGSKGTIEAGSLQFMTAGRGIVHAEMPSQNHDTNVGIQLWVDLPKHLKSCEPRYRDLHSSEIPVAKSDDEKVEVKVISGQSFGVDSVKDLAYTPVWILDFNIQPGGSVAQPLPKGWNSFLYTLEGETTFGVGSGTQKVGQFHNLVWDQEGEIVNASVDADAKEAARFILIAGQPMDHPIVQYGPFVVTSRDEVMQAFMDYQTHSNGFEKAAGWESKIGKSMA